MKHYFYFLSACLLFLSTGLQAQTLKALAKSGQASATDFHQQFEGVQGSPYLFNDWLPGEIILRDSSVLEEVHVLYDIFNDQLLARKENNPPVLVDKQKIRGFNFGRDGIKSFVEFRRAKYLKNFDKARPDHFVQILYDGPTALYAVHEKKKSDQSFSDTNTQYFMLSHKGKFVAVPDRQALVQVLGDERQKVEKFIKKNNILLNEGADLVKVAMFYDQLHL